MGVFLGYTLAFIILKKINSQFITTTLTIKNGENLKICIPELIVNNTGSVSMKILNQQKSLTWLFYVGYNANNVLIKFFMFIKMSVIKYLYCN